MKNRKHIIPIVIIAWLISMVGAWFLVNAITNSYSTTSKYTKITPSQLDDWYNRNRAWADSKGYSKDLAQSIYIAKKLREQGADFGPNPSTYDEDTKRRLYDEGFEGPNPYTQREKTKGPTSKYKKYSQEDFDNYWAQNEKRLTARNWTKDLAQHVWLAKRLNEQGANISTDVDNYSKDDLRQIYDLGFDGPNPYASTLDVIRYKIKDNITNIHVWCFSILTIIMLSAVITMSVINRKRKKRMEDSVQDELNNMTPQKQSNNKEIMKEKLTKVWSWIKQKKYYLIGNIILASVFVIFANIRLSDKITESHDDIRNKINKDIFENKQYFGTHGNSYTIVSYSKAALPSNSDSTLNKQQYGGIATYYKASGGWTIRLFKNAGDNVVEYSFKPYAVGLSEYPGYGYTPDVLFRELYQSLVDFDEIDVDNEYKIHRLQNLNSKFYKIKIAACKSGRDYGTKWFEYGGNKAYAKYREENVYTIRMKSFKTGLYRVVYNGAALIISFILCWLFIRVLKRKPQPLRNSYNLDISLNKTTETISNEKGVDELLTKLNPNNYMSPYDPQKVRIANDLYSALLQSRDNETIVSMIREKAKAELGIN